ncbi:MAG: CHAT domain-containing protein [Saprospiraceae bacterium]
MKMKTISTIILIMLSMLSFAQPTGDIEKDTALANQYFKTAILMQNYDSVAMLIEKAISLYEQHPFNEKILRYKGNLAAIYNETNRRKEGEQLALETIELAKKNLPNVTNQLSLGMAYFTLSSFYGNENPKLSIEYGYKAMQCFETGNLSYYFKASAHVIQKLSYSFQLDEIDSLITILEDKLVSNPSLEKYQVYIYQNKMVYYFKQNNFENAIIYGNKLFNENDKYKLLKPSQISSFYLTMGQIYTNLKKYEEAIEWIKKAMDITTVEKDNPRFGSYYIHIGRIYGEAKKFEKALLFYGKGIKLLEKEASTVKQLLVKSYFNYSNIYFQMGDMTNAKKYLSESKKYGIIPAHHYQMSKILAEQNKIDESVAELHKGLLQYCTYFKDENPLKNPSRYEVYKNTRQVDAFLYQKCIMLYYSGKAEKDAKKLRSSIELSRLTRDLRTKSWQASKGFDKSRYILSDNLSGTFKMTLLGEYELYKIEPSEALFEDFFKTSEQVKAMQLMETLSPSTLPKTLYEEEKELLEIIDNAGKELELIMARKQTDSIGHYQNKLFEASLSLENYNKKITTEYPKVANDFYISEYAKIKDIQTQISATTLVLSYNIMRFETHIVAISKSNKMIAITNFGRDIENIKKLNELIQDPFAFQNGVRNEFIDISHELYKTLIQPIESELEGKTRLMIVVEGQLFHLPFELLLKSNEKKPYHELDFLIKNYEINYHYSATAFLKLQEKETVKDNSLLAFAPVFSRGEELTEATRSLDFMIDSLYKGIDRNEFVALPSTKKEVNKIAKIVQSNNGKTNVLLQKKATKANFTKQLDNQSYQFVHIATHGLVNFKNPKLSALACYSKNETMDNLMYANEIQFKNINADLVILSSCESGIGQLVEGEGLIALNRSFIYSGAKNVLFSLWKVSDSHSSELMIDFYDNYFQNQSYTTALRNAKLKMLENPTSAQPKFWSAFVLMGE